MVLHIAVIFQRFLPYHVARIGRLVEKAARVGHTVTPIEVASQDRAYSFPSGTDNRALRHVCCFPGTNYHVLTTSGILGGVGRVLRQIRPDVVFSHASPFPEGMAAIRYRQQSGNKVIIMDDAWEHSDQRGFMTRTIKRLIHKSCDGVFVPAPSHDRYWQSLGFPKERIFHGVDVVDNDYFARHVDEEREAKELSRGSVQSGLVEPYFLFVGRFLPRKGLDALLLAYDRYRKKTGEGSSWNLVLVGSGELETRLRIEFGHLPGLRLAGPQFGRDLCRFYGHAQGLIVPSVSDPWALVVNEAMAAALPVIVSRGCGAAQVLVKEDHNGWTFSPNNDGELSELMIRLHSLSGEDRKTMGARSRALIGEWGLDRFAEAALQAVDVQKRPAAGFVSQVFVRLWKGRVRVY